MSKLIQLNKWVLRLLGGAAAIGAFALAANTASAAIITVTTSVDGFNDMDGQCSLREAIHAANTNMDVDGCSGTNVSGSFGADRIVFTPTISVITLTIPTGSVPNNNDDNEYLDLDVVVDQDPGDTTVFTLTIQGSGVTVIRDPALFQDRIFDILPPGSGAVAGGVRIENLFIQTGSATNANEETVPNTEVCYLGGGGVRHRSGGLLEIASGTVRFNDADGNGGGICQDGGSLRLDSFPFIANNQAALGGGGIYISGTADLTATLERNDAQSDGGGVYVGAGSTVTVTSSNVNNNNANQGDGGGFWNAGALTINGGSYNTNQAQDGGGIYNASNGSVTLTNAGVTTNTAALNGGGVYNENGGTVSISSAGIGPNNVANNGGGIWNDGVLNITSAGVTTNTANRNGGGVYNENGGTVSISSAGIGPNNRANNGGGIWNAGVLTITTAGVSDNRAFNGGGIYNDGTLTFSGGNVTNNRAFNGGGIYNGFGAATVNLAASQVNGNSATQQGGGIFNDGTLNVNGARVNNNSAGQAGGGIYNQNGTAVIFNFSQVNGNVISNTNFLFLPTQGGGVWNNATLVITSSSVNSNTAAATSGFATGGGIYNQSATALHITGTQVNSNTVTGSGFSAGGGVYNDFSSTIYITNSSVNSNTVTGSVSSGGGVYNRFSSTIYITNSSVNSNTVTGSGPAGGGVYNDSNGTIYITNSSVNGNTAAATSVFANAAGGGVLNNGGTVAIARSTINNNSAAGSSVGGFAFGGGVFNFFAFAPNALIIEDSQVNDNTASGGYDAQGGGVYNRFGAAEMRRGTIAGNVVSATNDAQGGGAFNDGSLLITETLVAQNTATATQQAQGGGAFNAASGVLTVTFSTLEQNQAQGGNAGQGGGAFSSGTMRIEGSTVQTNTASSDGGGVYRFNGLVDIMASTLAANQAISDGVGLYNNASVPDGGMIVQHSAVVSNTAQRGGSAYNLAGLLLMRNSTVSGNSGNGAIYADDSDPGPASSSNTQLQFVTVASNTGSVGLNVATGANATAYATLLAYNSGGNCAGFAFPLFSLSSDASCLGMSIGNPLLKPLALNGGGTLNHALSLGSPAVDKVPAEFCTVSTDQRYFSRPWFLTNACDIGAFELQFYYPVFVPIVRKP